MHRGRKNGSLFANKRGLVIKITLLAVLLLVIIIIVANANKQGTALDLNKVKKRGTLIVGISDAIPYFSDGEKGIEIELAQKIAGNIFGGDGKSTLTTVIMEQSFMDLHFSDSSIDMAIMLCPRGLYSSKYAYSEPYYVDKCLIVSADKNADEPVFGKRIGVITDSIEKIRLNEYLSNSKKEATVVEYPTYEIMLNDLKSGAIKMAVIQKVYYDIFEKNYKLTVNNTQLRDVEYSVACSIEDSDLIVVANKVIRGK